MKTVQDILKQRLATKHMVKQSIGALALEKLRPFATYPATFWGYVRNGCIFLRLDPAEDKLLRFTKKADRLAIVNKALVDFGYQVTLKDIRMKS
jgi:hypothetical protein